MTFKTKESRLLLILCSFFIVNALLSEFIGVKIFSVEQSLGFKKFDLNLLGVQNLSFNMSAGVLTWPLVFIFTDIINEYFGLKHVRFLSILTSVLIAFAGIFGQGMWIIVGSITAFLIGQIADVVIFHKIKNFTGEKALWLRATGSTLVSQCIDSFVVIFIAFYLNPQYNWSWQMVAAIGLVNYTYKFVVAVLMTPLLYLVHGIIDGYLGQDLSRKLLKEAAKS